MSWMDTLAHLTGNVGRGTEDLFTLGGTEVARKFGGQGAKNVLNPLGTALGANFEAGATGGSAMLGAQGLGAFGGAGGGSAGMSTPVMSQAGSTLGGGMGSPLNAAGPTMGAAPAAPGPSPVSGALQAMRSMPMGGGQQPAAPQQDPHQQLLQRIYQMYPNLRPHFGGM